MRKKEAEYKRNRAASGRIKKGAGERRGSHMALASVSALTLTAILVTGGVAVRMQDRQSQSLELAERLPPAVSDTNKGRQLSGPVLEPASPETTTETEASHETDSGVEGSVPTAGGAPATPPKPSPSPTASPAAPTALDRTQIRVYLTKEKRIEKVPMEIYIRGVLAGEMPVTFEPEALKAQAIAARTYIVRRLASGDHSGMPVEGADVTDTTVHQVYVPLDKLQTRWKGKERESNLSKLNDAVQDTRGEIITYDGSPIQALFFSTSNGYTENSEDYWAASLPYLRSVSSPWDKAISPEYKETTSMPLAVFYQKLGISENTSPRSLRVLDTTEGRRIRELAAGGQTFSGREVREKLGLASSQFTWKISGKKIEITTYGYGHGVGMSQWGADGMAQNGSSAYQILSHYYTGTAVVHAADIPRMST